MKNMHIEHYAEQDIKKQIEKILKGLGYPKPPLVLKDVRTLLGLDFDYYNSEDDSLLKEYISKLRIAGKQIITRPSLLLDVVKKAKLSALWLPDQKKILIDKKAPELKHRWMEVHEIGHSIIPWHRDYLLGDDSESLSSSCHEKLENEANFAAGQLLFLLCRFSDEANDMKINMNSILKLKKIFGNTITSTLWRFVEDTHSHVPMVGLISQIPSREDKGFKFETPCKYIIESKKFKEKISNIQSSEFYSIVKQHCSSAKRGFLGESEVILFDNNGKRHLFYFQTFSNTYEALTLGVYKRPVNLSIVKNFID